jgi:8-oxo-dGTP pyrophosphatase MutT (NUDIX family)
MRQKMRERALAALPLAQQSSSDFDLNPDVVLPGGRKLREAGVLILLSERGGRDVICLTKRSSKLKHHPGQIAFPGGKRDAGDASIGAAALREAHEEIGLPMGTAQIVGHLPAHETVTGFNVTPCVALQNAPFQIRPEPGEVDEVFFVPLAHVLNLANFSVQSRRWRGQQRAYFTVPYGPYYIWGATARMLRNWADTAQRL